LDGPSQQRGNRLDIFAVATDGFRRFGRSIRAVAKLGFAIAAGVSYDRSAMPLTVQLKGTFSLRPAPDFISSGDGGSQYGLHLQGVHLGATLENSQSQAYIDSTGSFAALPISGNMQGLVLFWSPNDPTSLGQLRVTYSTTGAVTFPARGTVILETDSTDHITGVEFQGVATVDWVLTGTYS